MVSKTSQRLFSFLSYEEQGCKFDFFSRGKRNIGAADFGQQQARASHRGLYWTPEGTLPIKAVRHEPHEAGFTTNPGERGRTGRFPELSVSRPGDESTIPPDPSVTAGKPTCFSRILSC